MRVTAATFKSTDFITAKTQAGKRSVWGFKAAHLRPEHRRETPEGEQQPSQFVHRTGEAAVIVFKTAGWRGEGLLPAAGCA